MNACVNACVFGSAKCASECTLRVSVFVWTFVCTLCILQFLYTTRFSAHGTLRVFADSTLLHTVHCAI